MLVEYFKKKRDVLIQFLIENKKYRIAIWGGGKRCKALLDVLGDYREYVDVIYDIDPSKKSSRIQGIKIVDYKEDKADIIILSSGAFLLDVYRRTEGDGKTIIDIDEMVAGNLSLEDLTMDKENSLSIDDEKEIKLCALVILYNPHNDVLKNIQSYIDEVDYLFIADNSAEENFWLRDVIMERGWKNTEYQWHEGENYGLANPINLYSRKATKKGYNWFITFDQDSCACEDMMHKMKEYAKSSSCGDDVALITPTRINRETDIVVESVPKISYVNDTIQSGAMHNLKVLNELGGYDENIFIDYLDLEYCARCIVNGYKIVKVNHAMLLHEILNKELVRRNIGGKEYLLGKYSPERYYYRHRNALYCIEKYKGVYPYFVYMCEEFLKFEEIMVNNDTCSEIKKRAMDRATSDYKMGVMGRLKGEL